MDIIYVLSVSEDQSNYKNIGLFTHKREAENFIKDYSKKYQKYRLNFYLEKFILGSEAGMPEDSWILD
jgi:hypothetical protein